MTDFCRIGERLGQLGSIRGSYGVPSIRVAPRL